MNNKNFDFGEALSFIKAGCVVSLITDKQRNYYMEDDAIYCFIEKSNAMYKVNHFYSDAVLSENWFIYEESLEK